MSASLGSRDVEQLQQLYTLREKRALEAIATQRIELDRVLGRLAQQQALIESLRDELVELHQLRSNSAIHNMTPTSLRAQSDRRHVLTQDLEMEDFYLPGFENDVSDARREIQVRERAWTSIREQIKSLNKVLDKNQSNARRRQSRLEDALLDDRRTPV